MIKLCFEPTTYVCSTNYIKKTSPRIIFNRTDLALALQGALSKGPLSYSYSCLIQDWDQQDEGGSFLIDPSSDLFFMALLGERRMVPGYVGGGIRGTPLPEKKT